MRVGIVDYGVGNLGSVLQALENLGAEAVLLRQPADMAGVDKLILPGVGSFTECMQRLAGGGWADALRHRVTGHGQPLLGICLGMQLLASRGLEGADDDHGTEGLGLVPGRVMGLASLGCRERVPHIGWNGVQARRSTTLLDQIPDQTDFYFVHGYAFVADDAGDVAATTDHGGPVTAVVQRGPVCGTQFHPEKSGRAGARLLRNFIEATAC